LIKTIIKRDGSKEPLSPDKINGWGEWAASKLGREVNWPEAVLHVVSTMPETCTSIDLQNALIQFCLNKNTWEYNLMAGRLYSGLINKTLYGNTKPTVQELHNKLTTLGMMVKLNYDDNEYAQVEKFINHKLDFNATHFELHQIRYKYAIRDKVRNKEYESQQFVYMRMAMSLAENEPKSERMIHVKKWYEHLSHKRLNAPTPNFTNLGTRHNGYASCCVYTTDDTASSLAAGDHVAYMMTVMSSGIGTHIKTRSLGDPIRGGMIEHQGKLPYYRSMVGAIGANLQNGRGGASTLHYTAYDPEVKVIMKAKNPMTPASKQVRGCDYSFGSNKFFARKAAKGEDVGLFSYAKCPELYESQYSKDPNLFEELYDKAIKQKKIKTFVPARELLVDALNEAYETGRHYLHFTDNMNIHTPFKETIYSSNLCQEIGIPTKPFKSVEELYKPYEDGNGEIGLCSLAGVVVSNIENDEQYAEVAYYALKMIDVCIHKSNYIFKNLEDTAKSRLSAGVGMMGLAHLMAKNNVKYSSQEGRDFIHELFETHMWHLCNASLKLGQELGNAPWINKTLWPEGWLPIDTYEKRVDELVTIENKRDWELLRLKIINNGGIRNSVLAAFMPGESSSLSAGTTNSVYPIRDYSLVKTNDTMYINYVSPDSTKLKDKYELSWDVNSIDLIKCYAIMQKWTDQGISLDLYRKIQGADKVGTSEMIDIYLNLVKYGLKSRYYQNSLTAKGIGSGADTIEEIIEDVIEDQNSCEGCSL
jgi:ribonucleoside-diphosphate reductase alpha chain